MKIFTSFDFEVQPPGTFWQSQESEDSMLFTQELHGLLSKKSFHRWTLEQRTILCVLDRWFCSKEHPTNRTLTIRDFHRLFVAYFDDGTEESRTSLAGLSDRAVDAQLRNLWSEAPEGSPWTNVFVETNFADTQSDWTATRMDIIAIAKENGIELITRGFEDKLELSRRMETSLGKRKRRWKEDYENDEKTVFEVTAKSSNISPACQDIYIRRSKSIEILMMSPFSSGVDATGKQLPMLYLLPAQLNQLTPPPSPTKVCQRYQALRPLPPIAFRGWDRNSHGINTVNGFLAGAYLTSKLIPPPGRDTDLFKTNAIIHLSPLPKPSSFISCAQHMLRPLHRGLHSDSNAYISIIDLHHIQAQSNIHPRIYHAKEIIRQFQIQGINQTTGGNYYYSGSHEWLVWGFVEKESVLASFSVDSFRKYSILQPKLTRILRLPGFEGSTSAKQYTRFISKTEVAMNQACGRAIGHWLAWAALPMANLNAVAQSIAQAWRFKGHQALSRQQSYLTGVQSGYRSFACPSEVELEVRHGPESQREPEEM